MRADRLARFRLARLARHLDWRPALAIIEPETLIRWHRAGFRLLWRWKSSRRGRPPLPRNLRALIAEIAHANPCWGEERIADELRLKLGLRVSPRTVRRHMPEAPRGRGRPGGDQRWTTFVRNHAETIVACDFFVVVTATFRLVYVFVQEQVTGA